MERHYYPVFPVLLIIGLFILAVPVSAADITIVPNDPVQGSIRGAIINASAGDRIILGPGTYTDHDILIDKDITIMSQSGSAADTIIDAMRAGRIFFNGAGHDLTIDSLTLQNATVWGDFGGAIVNDNGGNLTVTSSRFFNCSANVGGAIFNNHGGTVTITGSAFTDCSSWLGGAIANYYESPGTVTVTSSEFTRCTVSPDPWDYEAQGGAISNDGTLTVTGSTFTDCSAQDALYVSTGGAIFNRGTATITSSVFNNCHTGLNNYYLGGGAIANFYGTLLVTSSTFNGCSAAYGGGAIINDGTLTMNFSRIVDCGPTAAYGWSGTANAENNWWGSSASPPVGGSIDATPWLVLGITADPTSIDMTGTSAIRTNLTYNSDNLAPGGGYVPDGITNTYAMVSGSGSVLPLMDMTVNGGAQTTFTPAGVGAVNISGTVDDQTVYIELPVAHEAPAVTAITPDSGVNSTDIAITNLAGSAFTISGTTVVRLTRAGHANITATGVTVVSPSQITCTLPINGAEAGAWDVVVVNPDGQEAVLPGGFTVIIPGPAPTPPTPVPTYSQQDTGETLGDFPQSPANPVMTVTVNVGGDSKAWQAVVTGTNLRDLIVTGTEQHGPFGTCNPPAGSVFQYLGLEPARYGTITDAVISFTVPQAWLDENHVDPKSIVLYHMTPDCWQALPTNYLFTKDGIAYFSGRSSGFSQFAIAGMPGAPATPALVVTTLQETPAEVGRAPVAAADVKAPATAETTAPPAAPPQAPAGSSGLPLVTIASIALCCVGLVSFGWYARRWWIRRQNPDLFREYD